MALQTQRQALGLRGPRLPALRVKHVGRIQPSRAAAAEAPAPEAPAPIPSIKLASTDEGDRAKPFPYPLPMDPQQKMLSGIPMPLFYPALAAFVGGVGLVGSLAGRAAPVEPENKEIASYAVAAVGAAAAAYGAVNAKKKRDSCAVLDLYNSIVDLNDPSELTPALVSQVGGKYGINMQRDDLDGLKKIYGQYLEALIPSGDVQLKGDEGPKILAFRDALGMSDEDAAPVHIEVARRLFRQGYETKDRSIQFEQRKAFQRLIYVSQIVFGDQKAAFLLPWRRHFNVTDAQIFVARRDNARTIFRTFLEQQGGELRADRHFLRALRDTQTAVKLMDEAAVEVIKEAARKHVEQRLEKAIGYVRANTKVKDVAAAVAEVGEVLEYSRKLARYANEEDLVPGLGPVTITGGPLTQEGRARDLKDLYKSYIEARMDATGEYSAELEADARDLQAMLGLSAATAQGLTDEVAAKLYKRLLREEVASGRLDAASSPAEVLGSLCERVRFSPEAALELHKGLYKTKLQTLMVERRNVLSESDAAELARIRRILCLPADTVRKAQKDTVGKVLEEAISDIYMMGAKPVSESDLDTIDKAVKDLRIEPDTAMEIFTSVTRERLRSYVQQALKERGTQQDRKAEAAAIKKLVQFNAIVVTPLLDRVKGLDAAKKELAELMAKAMESAKKEGLEGPEAVEAAAAAVTSADRSEQVKQVQKAMQAARGEFGEEERKGQKEITLREDVSPENRALLYKDYLMHTMTGDVVELPVGGTIRRKSSQVARQADMARLQALADLLGMNQVEVAAVHGDLAESAYKAQASEVLRSGPMTEEKAAYLEDMRGQLGLGKEQADKALKAARTEVYGTAVAAEDGGKWTLERISEVTAAGGSIEGLVEEVTRRNLFRREFERRVGDGTGNFDAEYMLKKLPEMLGLEERKVKSIVKELVATRKRMLMVQAVSQLRQRRPQDAASSLNNLLSCNRALPEKSPMAWSEHSELKEMFASYCAKEDDEGKRAELAALLGLSEAEAAAAAAGTGIKSSAAGGPGHDDESIF